MRQLKGNWKDLFYLFRTSMDFPKLFKASVMIVLAFVVVTAFNAGIIWIVDGASIPDLVLDGGSVPGGEGSLSGPVIALSALYSFFWSVLFEAMGIGGFWGAISLVGTVLLLIIIVGWSGTGICRMAAYLITRDEKIQYAEASGYSADKLSSAVFSFLSPILFIILCSLPILLLGVTARIPVIGSGLLLIWMVLLPLALVASFLIVAAFLSLLFGFPLYLPSLAVEGTDAMDALNHGFSYVITRPWAYFGYWLLAAIYGAICTAIVFAFTVLVIWTLNGLGALAVGESFTQIASLNLDYLEQEAGIAVQGAALAYYFWTIGFVLLAYSFPISYFFSASVMIYLLMRKKVDLVEMEEIYEDLSEEEEIFFDEPPIEDDEDIDPFEDESSESEEEEQESEEESGETEGEESRNEPSEEDETSDRDRDQEEDREEADEEEGDEKNNP